MLNLLVFALIGFVGAALIRMIIPALQSLEIAPVLVAGLAGAVIGGLCSWYIWPKPEAAYHYSGILMSALGAMLTVWGFWIYMEKSSV